MRRALPHMINAIAYDLKYQTRRPDSIAAWWNVVNRDAVNARF